jgi:hypothetical protein
MRLRRDQRGQHPRLECAHWLRPAEQIALEGIASLRDE